MLLPFYCVTISSTVKMYISKVVELDKFYHMFELVFYLLYQFMRNVKFCEKVHKINFLNYLDSNSFEK